MIVSGTFDWIDGPILNVHVARTPGVSDEGANGSEQATDLQFRALIDTGATYTAIVEVARQEIQAEPIGKMSIQGAHGEVLCPTCVVDLILPTDTGYLTFRGMTVPVFGMRRRRKPSDGDAPPEPEPVPEPAVDEDAIPPFQVVIGRNVLSKGTLTMTANSFTLELPDRDAPTT